MEKTNKNPQKDPKMEISGSFQRKGKPRDRASPSRRSFVVTNRKPRFQAYCRRERAPLHPDFVSSVPEVGIRRFRGLALKIIGFAAACISYVVRFDGNDCTLADALKTTDTA